MRATSVSCPSMARRAEVSWRESVLQAMLNALSLAAPAILVMGLVLRKPPLVDRSFVLIVSTVVVIVALRFLGSLPFRLRALLSVASIQCACLAWIALSGFAIGAAAGLVGGIVIAMMLLGRRAAIVVLAA